MDQRITGAQINAALYLIGVFVLGTMQNSVWPVRLSIATAGVTYLSYVIQLVAKTPNQRAMSDAIVVLSIALGIAAGAALFF